MIDDHLPGTVNARERQSLAGRAILALIAAATLAACADEPSAPRVTIPTVSTPVKLYWGHK